MYLKIRGHETSIFSEAQGRGLTDLALGPGLIAVLMTNCP